MSTHIHMQAHMEIWQKGMIQIFKCALDICLLTLRATMAILTQKDSTIYRD